MDRKWRNVVLTTARSLGSIAHALKEVVEEDKCNPESENPSGHSDGQPSGHVSPAPNAANAATPKT
jgi:hypothetical protein